jgi:hypothetical protein
MSTVLGAGGGPSRITVPVICVVVVVTGAVVAGSTAADGVAVWDSDGAAGSVPFPWPQETSAQAAIVTARCRRRAFKSTDS